MAQTALALVVLLSIAWQATELLASLSPVIWSIYTRIVPSKASYNVSQLRQQQADVLKIRREMAATSSQDEFAKWARLRREHDKKVNELEKLSANVASQRLALTGWISAARWIILSGVGLIVQFWYRKQPVFWLPDGLVHPYVEFILAFPQAPRGSISINVWSACSTVAIGALLKISGLVAPNAQPQIVRGSNSHPDVGGS